MFKLKEIKKGRKNNIGKKNSIQRIRRLRKVGVLDYRRLKR